MKDYNPPKQKKEKFKSKYVKPPTQLNMELKESWFNKFFGIKRKIVSIEDKMRFSRFYRSIWTWLSIFTGLTASTIAIIYVMNSWNRLPSEIAAFNVFNLSKSKLVYKEVLIFISLMPIIAAISMLVLHYYDFKSYEKIKFLIFQIVLITSGLTIYGLYTLLKVY